MTRLLRDTDEDLPPDLVGGKAAMLARMSRVGLQVPSWFVIPPAWGPLNADDAREVVRMARIIAPGGERFAVRSSALEEDGEEHSFAGQLDSFVDVPLAELAEKVEAVRRSAEGERVEAYRQASQLPEETKPPAVIIQRMLNPVAAGVAFSADPVSGRRGLAVVSAVNGLGTDLVSGLADADTFRVDRKGRVVWSASRQGEDSRDRGVAVQPSITEAQACRVAALARAAELACGRPQDVEWALEGDTLWLLQSRPITSLTRLVDPDGEICIWDNANIAESYSGVTTPLTYSFARGIYEAVYREFARLMGVSETRIRENQDLFPRMLGLIRGRIYYNLVSWYRLLAMLPGYGVNRAFMEQMMGVKEGLPADVLARIAPRVRGWARFRDGLALARSVAGLLRNHVTLLRQIARFQERLGRALAPGPFPLAAMRPDELVARYRALERQLLLRWDAPLVNDFFAMIFYGVLRRLTAKWCGDADGTLQNDLIGGEGGMISAEPARRVRELAELLSRQPAAVALFCDGTRSEIGEWLSTAPELRQRLEAYLEKFGDRCLEELKLESATLHDDPLVLYRSIGQYARRFGRDGFGEGGVETALRAKAEARVDAALRGYPLRRMVFRWVLRHARARVRDRENLRFERTRLFGHVRRICLELGRRFHASRQLADPRDIFWLTIEEVLGFVEGTTPTTRLAALAEVRRAEFAGFRRGRPPADRFPTQGAVHLANSFEVTPPIVKFTSQGLKGIGCCPGLVRGRARVILDPRQAEIEPGEILVAARTDPGWIMLFPSAAGLLVEHGSLLSHSAIVAREMGIPAIVSIAGVTQCIRTGDWIEMDGATGRVRRAEP